MIWDQIKTLLNLIPGVNMDTLAGGTDSAKGGLTLVGEEGPELVNMPRGSQVFTAGETSGMMSGGSTFNAPLINIGRVDASNQSDVDSLLSQMGTMLENRLGSVGQPQGSLA